MKKILSMILSLSLLSGIANATLTPGTIPVDKVGGSSPQLQNGSITDTGTASGAGNVGIGSSNPGQVLDVQGTVRTTGFTLSGATSAGYVLTDVNGDNILTLEAATSSSVTTGTPGQAAVYTSTTQIGSSSLLTDTGANIGIGTTTPSATLEVDGSVFLNAIPSQIYMKSPNGNCWIQTVDNSGNGNWNSTTCPAPPSPTNDYLLFRGQNLLFLGSQLTS